MERRMAAEAPMGEDSRKKKASGVAGPYTKTSRDSHDSSATKCRPTLGSGEGNPITCAQAALAQQDPGPRRDVTERCHRETPLVLRGSPLPNRPRPSAARQRRGWRAAEPGRCRAQRLRHWARRPDRRADWVHKDTTTRGPDRARAMESNVPKRKEPAKSLRIKVISMGNAEVGKVSTARCEGQDLRVPERHTHWLGEPSLNSLKLRLLSVCFASRARGGLRPSEENCLDLFDLWATTLY